MSLETDVSCAGAPRDLGHDLGRALGARVRARVGRRSIATRVRDAVGLTEAPVAAWLRDVRRYFPHQHEWIQGLARGAALPVPAVVRTSMAVLEAERDALLVAAELEGRVRLWRRVPASAVLRRVEPEGRFAALELGAAGLTPPWIGVNDRGVAVAVAGGASPSRGRHAHGALFARDVLERFDGLESALDWCLGRPAAPGAAVLMADASGAMTGVVLEADGRPLRAAREGVLVVGGEAGAAAALEAELAKRLATPDAFEAKLREALVGTGTHALACVDPSRRRIARDAAVCELV